MYDLRKLDKNKKESPPWLGDNQERESLVMNGMAVTAAHTRHFRGKPDKTRVCGSEG
jgi:hypothetical protein